MNLKDLLNKYYDHAFLNGKSYPKIPSEADYYALDKIEQQILSYEQELSQLRPIVQELAIEFNKHKNHGEHCTCEYCYLLKDIPELKSILTTGEAKPN